jgi:hypothetical protein
MILGIDLPKGAKIETDNNNKVFIIFDENITKRDLWKALFTMWLTKGNTVNDFYINECLNSKSLEVSKNNKLRVN